MYTASIAVDDVIDALADFLTPFLTGWEIVRAQVNRVPLPKGPSVVLTELTTVDLSVPTVAYDPANSAAAVRGPKRIDIQMDFYGEGSSERATTVQTMLRNEWAFEHFPPTVKPLYASDALQAPMVTGEQQWASRWTLTASLQYNPIVTVAQQFADAASMQQVLAADL